MDNFLGGSSLDRCLDERLRNTASAFEVEQLEKRVADLEVALAELKKSPSYDKEFYTAHDYAAIMHLEPSTVTQNYFRTQRIKAEKKEGCKFWVTTADEFRRVEAVVNSVGVWALNVAA